MDVVFVVSELVDVLLFFQFICFRRCASCVLMLICLCFLVACFIFIIIFLVLCPFPFYTVPMQVTRLQVILSGHEYLACRCLVQDDLVSSPASGTTRIFQSPLSYSFTPCQRSPSMVTLAGYLVLFRVIFHASPQLLPGSITDFDMTRW